MKIIEIKNIFKSKAYPKFIIPKKKKKKKKPIPKYITNVDIYT